MNAQTQYEYRCEASYQRQFDDDDLVCNKVDELMSGDYNPNSFDNAAEALYANPIQLSALERAMTDGDLLLVGEIISVVSQNYWLTKAEKDAPGKVEADAEKDAGDRWAA